MRLRIARRLRLAAEGIWEWAELDRDRPLTEADVILVDVVVFLDRLAARLDP